MSNVAREMSLQGIVLLTVFTVTCTANITFDSYPSPQLQALLNYPNEDPSYFGWVGSDVAISIHLKNDIYIWIWGDTLIGQTDLTEKKRYNISFDHFDSTCNDWPHGTIGIYHVYSSQNVSKLQYFYKMTPPLYSQHPLQSGSFFYPYQTAPTGNDVQNFFWYTAGISDGQSRILILALNITCTGVGTDFKPIGTTIIVIENANDTDPLNWSWQYHVVPNSNYTLIWTSAITYTLNESNVNDEVYWIGFEGGYEPNSINVICKTSLSDLMSFNFDNIVYYGYDESNTLDWFQWNDIKSLQWIIDQNLGWNENNEFTIFYDNTLQKWYTFLIYESDTTVRLYTSIGSSIVDKYEWVMIYKLPQPFNDLNLYHCYGAKSHPELIGYSNNGTDFNQLVFTYQCLSWNVSQVFDANMLEVYVPQFVVVDYNYSN